MKRKVDKWQRMAKRIIEPNLPSSFDPIHRLDLLDDIVAALRRVDRAAERRGFFNANHPKKEWKR